MIRILGLSGSLRRDSSNSRMIRTAQSLAPEGMEILIYEGMGRLPFFTPDLDVTTPPEPVVELRAQIGKSDGLLLSSPEYAHGVPGTLKNALDWLVASVEFPGLPVALIGGGEFAQSQLEETLRTMSAKIVSNRLIPSPELRAAFNEKGELRSALIRNEIRESLEALKGGRS